MHSKRSLCSWPYRCSEPCPLLRLDSVEPAGDGNSPSPNWFPPSPSSANGKEVRCSACLFLSLKSPSPSGRLDPSVYFSSATPATSTMSNLLYTLTSSTTTHLSYREVSITHALQTSRCSPRVLVWLTAVFSAPVFLRFRGRPKKEA